MSDIKLVGGGVFTFRTLRHRDVIQMGERGIDRVVGNGGINDLDAYVEIDHLERHNMLPDGGLSYLLDVAFNRTSQVPAWYVALFINNVTPTATWGPNWAAAASGTGAQELPDAAFEESGRQALAFSQDASGGSIQAPTAVTFTIAAGQGPVDIYGATLNSSPTVGESGTAGVLLAASKLPQPRLNVGDTDKFQASYVFTLSNG